MAANGPIALFLANALSCISLLLLAHSAESKIDRTEILLLANLFAAVIGFCIEKREPQTFSKKAIYSLVFFSLAFCVGYGLFVVYRNSVSISLLIVCQSLAPILSVYFSGDSKKSSMKLIDQIIAMIPVLLLLGIAYIEHHNSLEQNDEVLFILFAIFLSFVVSQTSARYVAQVRSSQWSQPRLTLLNSFFLLIGILIFSGIRLPHLEAWLGFLERSFVIGAIIALVQRFYVFGLKYTEPFLSALIMCTTVPLAVMAEFIFESKKIPDLEVALSITYVVAVSAKLAIQNKKRTYTSLK